MACRGAVHSIVRFGDLGEGYPRDLQMDFPPVPSEPSTDPSC